MFYQVDTFGDGKGLFLLFKAIYGSSSGTLYLAIWQHHQPIWKPEVVQDSRRSTLFILRTHTLILLPGKMALTILLCHLWICGRDPPPCPVLSLATWCGCGKPSLLQELPWSSKPGSFSSKVWDLRVVLVLWINSKFFFFFEQSCGFLSNEIPFKN